MNYYNFKVNTVVISLIACFSGFYIIHLPVSPVYIFTSLGAFILFCCFMSGYRLTFNSLQFLLISFVLYILGIHAFRDIQISSFINMVFSLAVFILLLMTGNKINLLKLYNLGERIVLFVIPLLIFESYYRISNPVFYADFEAMGKESLVFYFYKMNSIMFPDSNFVAMVILSCITFIFYMQTKTKKKYFLVKSILTILCILTFSRAAIASAIIFWIGFILRKQLFKYRKIFIPLGLISVIIIYPILLEISMHDESFASKFEIIQSSISFLKIATLQEILFGVGLGNTVKYLGIGAHNIFVFYLIETGVIGLLFKISILFYIAYITKQKASIMIIPFLINGMSLTSPAIAYFYAMLAFIVLIECRKNLDDQKFSISSNTSIQC